MAFIIEIRSSPRGAFKRVDAFHGACATREIALERAKAYDEDGILFARKDGMFATSCGVLRIREV